jgi:hypothetical protein
VSVWDSVELELSVQEEELQVLLIELPERLGVAVAVTSDVEDGFSVSRTGLSFPVFVVTDRGSGSATGLVVGRIAAVVRTPVSEIVTGPMIVGSDALDPSC